MGYEWLMQEAWGIVHPHNNWQWYDKGCVRQLHDGTLELSTRINPKIINVYDPDLGRNKTVFPKTSIGLVCCQYPFTYGYYKIVAKLPAGANLWPAIWAWGGDWDREIDIIEAYSNSRGSYHRCGWPFWKIWKLQSNFHYKDNSGSHQVVGAKNMFVGFRRPESQFLTYEMDWDPKFITISINGKIKRTLKGDVMKYFNKPVQFIINNGVRRENKIEAHTSRFLIKSFEYDEY